MSFRARAGFPTAARGPLRQHRPTDDHSDDGGLLVIAKGSPEAIVHRGTSHTPAECDRLLSQASVFAESGYRVLAVGSMR